MPTIAEEQSEEVDAEASICMTETVQTCTEVEVNTANNAEEAEAEGGLTQMIEDLSESEDDCEV